MNPGRMDRRITIQKRTQTRDSIGSVIEAWADHVTVWGEDVRQSGNETLSAGSDRASDSRQFRIRYREGLTSDSFRIKYQSKFYDIRHIAQEGRENRLLVTATWNQSIT